MPLLDSDFDREFLEVSIGEKIAQALARLGQEGGHDDWHLILRRGPQWYAVQVCDLKSRLVSLGPNLFEMTFEELLPVFREAYSAQQDRIGIGTAEDWVTESGSHLLVVMRGEQPAGRFFRGVTRGGELFPTSSMAQLYGDYITVAPDRRSEWAPTGVKLPICPKCGYQGWYRFNVDNGALECVHCGHRVEE
jgi:hypothetical protein